MASPGRGLTSVFISRASVCLGPFYQCPAHETVTNGANRIRLWGILALGPIAVRGKTLGDRHLNISLLI